MALPVALRMPVGRVEDREALGQAERSVVVLDRLELGVVEAVVPTRGGEHMFDTTGWWPG